MREGDSLHEVCVSKFRTNATIAHPSGIKQAPDDAKVVVILDVDGLR